MVITMEETKPIIPNHEKVKLDLLSKFVGTSSYLGSHIRAEIQKTDFKVLKDNNQKPSEIRKADCIVVKSGIKSRPAVIVKVLKDRTCIYIPVTSTENVHCLTPFKSRFLGEGCFSRNFSVCTEEFAIENFVHVFDDTKALNQAIKDLKEFINKSL